MTAILFLLAASVASGVVYVVLTVLSTVPGLIGRLVALIRR